MDRSGATVEERAAAQVVRDAIRQARRWVQFDAFIEVDDRAPVERVGEDFHVHVVGLPLSMTVRACDLPS